MGVLDFINYLAIPVSHILTNCWWIRSSYWQYCTWGYYPPIALAEFAKPPQNKLFIGSFPETLHGEIEIICPDLTSSLDGNFKDVPVKADIVECLKSCNTGHPLTTISISFGIGLHTLHLHHSGEVSQGLEGGGGGGAFFSSKLALPMAKTFLRGYAMSSLWRGAWNSCVKQIVKHQSTLLLPVFVPKYLYIYTSFFSNLTS